MTALFRWLHLSDIHVGHGDAEHGWDQRFVMDRLRADAIEIAAQEPLDVIVVTGDVAFSGAGRRPDEYTRASAFLLELGKAVRLGPEQIFVVPGNHDVNRGVDRERTTQRLLESLREGRDRLDNALADPGDRALLTRRLDSYLAFAAAFAPACLGGATPPEARLFWSHRLPEKNGLRVRLLGLNSALLCADERDHGRLALGLEQVTRTLTEPPVEPHELVIALSHHPLQNGWLADQKEADARLRSRAHVLLSGHVHEADAEEARSGAGGSFVRVTAGAAHGEREPAGVPASHGYSFGEVVALGGGKLELRIRPRKWSPRNAAFRPDVDNVPDGQDRSRHALSVTTAAPVSAPAPAPVEGPLKVFFSYAPEDDAARIEIEKSIVMLRRKKQIEIIGAGGSPGVESSLAGLRAAQVIVLLLSPDYLASEWSYDREMVEAVERHQRGEVRLVPVLIRTCDYAGAPFERLFIVPPFPRHYTAPPVAVSVFPPERRDAAMMGVGQAIQDAVEHFRERAR